MSHRTKSNNTIKTALVLQLAVLAILCQAVGAFAQGQINFGNNLGATTFRAPIFGPDPSNPSLEVHGQPSSLGFPAGTTVYGGARLDGARYQLELLAGYSESQMRSAGTFGFLTGSSVGFVVARPGYTLPDGFAVGSKPIFEIRAWDTQSGATYDVATIRGTTGILNPQIALGGIDIAGNPVLPSNLTGWTSFNIHVVPEPSTIALGILGLGSLLLFGRKKG